MMPTAKRLILVVAVLFSFGALTYGDAVPVGTTSLPFTSANACVGGGNTCTPGSASGYFIYDPTTNQVTSWDFVLTGSSDGSFSGANGGPVTFSSADTSLGATASLGGNFYSSQGTGNNLGITFQELNTSTVNQFTLVLLCAVTNTSASANCLDSGAPLNSSYQLLTDPVGSATSGLSGETVDITGAPLTRSLAPGFLDVTDPNGSFAFNLSSSDTISTGTGGGSTNVPEPNSGVLLAIGVAMLGLLSRGNFRA